MKRVLLRPELLCLPLLVAFAALLLWPLALLFFESVVSDGSGTGFTLRRYLDVVRSRDIARHFFGLSV